jgi:alpha-N-arabinofuranosidase
MWLKKGPFKAWTRLLTGIIPALALSDAARVMAQPADEAIETRSLTPPVMLPDGTEFRTWEQTPVFTRTYHVNPRHPAASDRNPGTREHPFATIGHAAELLQPGERVVVAPGVYRERIRPARGGAGPTSMIAYEAEPGAEVVLKGSRLFHGPWTSTRNGGATIWQANLDPKVFEGYNPFDIENVTTRQFDIMDFAAPLRGTPPCSLPRGLVFQNGRRLTQVARRPELEKGEGVYWVDRPEQTLHVRFFGDARPEQVTIEITTQETVFAPETMGLGFIRVKGFTVEQVAGPFPWEQVGAISTTRGHHWIIEDNTVRSVNGVGIDVGVQLHQWPQPPIVGQHIVRHNRVSDCGICGIAGMGPGGREFGLLIEDNELRGNAFHDVERLYETASIKTHCNVHCLIRRNLIVDTQHGPGIWMDWDNRFSRCCQNVIVDTRSIAGGIFIEASQQPNLIDRNIVWGTQGHGIYEHDCHGQVFAHNFVARSSGSAFHLHGRMTSRRIDGKQPSYGGHVVHNNLLVDNRHADFLGGEPSRVRGNLVDAVVADLDRATWRLDWHATSPVSKVARVPLVPSASSEASGQGESTAPGPFLDLPVSPTSILIWPVAPR